MDHHLFDPHPDADISMYEPFCVRRGLFHWRVGAMYHGYDSADSGFDVMRRFWRLRSATAYLVQLSLEGKEVQF